MKRLLILLIFAPIFSFGQINQQLIENIKLQSNKAKASWWLSYKGSSSYPLPNISTLKEDIKNYADTVTPSKKGIIINNAYINKTVDGILKNVNGILGIKYDQIFVDKWKTQPNELLLISGIYTQDVYNNQKLSIRQRASRIIAEYSIPCLKSFTVSQTVKYYGVGILYGGQNPINDKLEGEIVIIISPSNIVHQFCKNEITEDELLLKSDMFISGGEYGSDLRKVKLSIE